MFNHVPDPLERLEELELATIFTVENIDAIAAQLNQQSQLIYDMSEHIRQLTRVMTGMNRLNKVLEQRLTMIENQ